LISIPDRLYLLYLRAFARECKACFLWESEALDLHGENVYAISPAGLGVGVGQQSLAWQNEYMPTSKGVPSETMLADALRTDRRWHPVFQIACYAEFCARSLSLDMESRWRLYHYGHIQPTDPDGYVRDVMTWWNKLANWPEK
jgi:hypothetical protein